MSTTAITNVTLFDGSERTERRTVVFEERVTAVGPASELLVPGDIETIDGSGHTLLPGLVDMHVHVFTDDGLGGYLAQGVTTIKDVGNDLAKILEWRRATAAGEIPGPRIELCGAVIDGESPMWPEWSFAVDDPASAVRAVDELAAAGVDGLKLYVYLEPDAMRAVLVRAHEHGLAVTAHLGATRASVAIELGLDGIEHAAQGYYDDVVPPELILDATERVPLGLGPFWARFMAGWAAVDVESERVRRFVELVAEHDVFVTPTLVVLERTLEGEDDDLRRLTDQWTDEDFAIAWSGFEGVLGVVGALHAGGATVVAGSDTGVGESLHRELELLVRAGLSPPEALRSATSVATSALRHSDEGGTVAAGRLADLLLVEGDPTRDIGAIRRTRAVFKSGQRVAGKQA